MVKIGDTGIEVSDMIQGTWVMGKDYWGGAEDVDSINAIGCAFKHGITSFDTAYIYGEGHAEELLGNALKGIRQECTIITKLWKTEMKKERVHIGLEEAMKRLQTDYIDVFFIHYPSETVPIEDTMEELMKCRKQGKIGAIGVSNFSLQQLKQARQYGKIDIIQPCYSLLWRFIDTDILPYCIENGIAIIPYSPLGQGILTGKMSKGYEFGENDSRKNTPLFSAENFGNALLVTEEVKKIAEKYGKTPSQTAINWVMQYPGMTAPIVGARNNRQVDDNIGAVGWKMDIADFNYLDEISKKFAYQLPLYKTLFDKAIIR